jgi:membrane associated rhomboid family serine protease
MFLFFLAIVGAFALYVMSPDERTRLFGRVVRTLLYIKDTAIRIHSARDPFHDAIFARTPWPIVTPALVLLNVAVFARMLFGDGAIGDPETLVAWGGNYGPRTTNGEWWRLLTSAFVHAGLFHLLADIAALTLLGLMLERLVGYFAFTTVYVACGVFASLASLSSDPMAVSVGAAGSILGLCGLLIASTAWGFIHRSSLTIPLLAAKKIGPGLAVFIVYSAATGRLDASALNGLVMGLVCGLVLARGYAARKPPALRTAAALASTLVITVAAAFPLRGFTDVKPELESLVAFETRSATLYEKAVEQFRLGGMSAEALAQVINRTILPDLQAANARINALDRVPSEHRSMIAAAAEYLRLRGESWRLRVEGLHTHSMPTLQKADRTERASLDVLEGVRPPEQK